MQLQHVNVKLFVEAPAPFDLEPLIPVFQSWIQEPAHGDLLLDIADYRHVEAGPGVVLIGYEGNYSVDNSNNRLGVRYNRKTALDGNNQDRLAQAARAALAACQRLESESRLGGKLRFNGKEIEISVNDRLLAPNTRATQEAAGFDLRLFAEKLFPEGHYSMTYEDDARRLFAVQMKTTHTWTVADLLKRLS